MKITSVPPSETYIPETKYILAVQNKLTEDPTQPPSNKRFPIKKNAKMMVALSPSYSFNFEKNTLILNSPEKETTTTDSQIAAFSQLPKTEQLVFFIGTGEAGTHQAIINNIYLKKMESTMKLKSFDEALKEGMLAAKQEEIKWTKGMQPAFDTALAGRNPIESSEYKSILLTSQVSNSTAFKKLYEQIAAYYHSTLPSLDDQKMFVEQVTTCVTLAIRRLFKPIFPKSQKKGTIPLFCSVKDITGEAYDANRFIHILMVTHLLREMAHLVLVTSAMQIDYILHPKSRNPHENNAMDTVLRMSMSKFAPKSAKLGQWLSYTLKLADIPKASVYTPSPEIKHTSPMLISTTKDLSSEKDKNMVVSGSPDADSEFDLSDSTGRSDPPTTKDEESFEEEDICESPPASPSYSKRSLEGSLESKQIEDILEMMTTIGKSHLPVKTREKFLTLFKEEGSKILRPVTVSRRSPPIIPAQPEEKAKFASPPPPSSALNPQRVTHTQPRVKHSASAASTTSGTTPKSSIAQR